ncbi:MAG: hypothetical protein AAB414_05060, partial [Patescibacteria group bacterium]
MTKLLSINFIRSILLIGFACLAIFIAASSVFSQSPSPATEDSGSVAPSEVKLVFPIEDLGGCASLEDCTNYCEDPVNYNSCKVFAKEQGFYKDDVSTYADQDFWNDAQGELGCNSTDLCITLCSDPASHPACDSFAKRNEIPGGYVDEPDKPEYLAIAQDVLGCDSAASCGNFCDDPANADKCTDFANQVGLLGGTTAAGPGDCQTPETCGVYCSDPANFGQCSSPNQGGNTGFAGPGGCNSEASCRTYCDQNPEQCRSYSPGSSGVYITLGCSEGEYHGPGGVCTALADTQKAASCVGSNKYWDGSACQDTPPVGINP